MVEVSPRSGRFLYSKSTCINEWMKRVNTYHTSTLCHSHPQTSVLERYVVIGARHFNLIIIM